MNRIIKYLKKSKPVLNGDDLPDIDPFFGQHNAHAAEDKAPTQNPKDAPDYCAFCCAKLEGKEFKAFSKVNQPSSAICCDCIAKFALISRFTCETFDIYFQPGANYSALQAKILKRIAGEEGSDKTKQIVADLAVRLLKRASAVLSGKTGTCDRTGVDLKDVRIALVGSDARNCAEMLEAAVAETAMLFSLTTRKKLMQGVAFAELKQRVNSENHWASALGILFCAGYAEPNAACSVIFACDSALEVPEDVEVINVNG